MTKQELAEIAQQYHVADVTVGGMTVGAFYVGQELDCGAVMFSCLLAANGSVEVKNCIGYTAEYNQ
jgi:hypothetical protein